ncbi:MAG TPA: GyrI-like domain-containing protein [Solirubrobacteraceae bacterium]
MHRDEQPYVAVRTRVTMEGLAGAVDRYFAELFGWAQARNLEPSGAPFIRYLRVEMDGDLEIELALPVGAGIRAQDNVHAGVLPAGRYVTTLHIGPYDGLVNANAELQEWGQRHGIRWAMDEGRRWGARVERYLTDPRREPDPSRWQTELAYLASDD